MKTLLPLIFFSFSGYAQTKQNYALVIHGGAGVMVREKCRKMFRRNM
jgi:roadblock/LC7 domain-containing protein